MNMKEHDPLTTLSQDLRGQRNKPLDADDINYLASSLETLGLLEDLSEMKVKHCTLLLCTLNQREVKVSSLLTSHHIGE